MMRRLAILPLSLLLISAYVLGCDSADNPIAPTGSTLTLSASPTTIALSGETSTISITGFRPDGNPLNPGTQLTMSTTLGVLKTSAGATTNIIEVTEGGRATARLEGDGRQGTATVTVSLTNGGDGASATSDIQIGLATNDKPTVTLGANPSEVGLNEVSTITVTARRSDGTPLTSGNVSIRTNLGQLSFNGDSSATLSVPLSGSNTVDVSLQANQAGTATVTAFIGASDEVTTTVDIGTVTTGQPTLRINANPTEIPPLGTSTITVTARQANGLLLVGGSVSIQSSLGSLDRTSATTGSSGTATFELTAGTQTGDATITASVDSSEEGTATVTISPPVVTLVANPNTVDVGETSEVQVTARDSTGNLLSGSTTATMTSSGGDLQQLTAPFSNGRLTLTDGRATVNFVAGDNAGAATVGATVPGSVEGTVSISIRDLPDNVTLSLSTSNIGASGTSVITLTATVTNSRGIVLPNEPVSFEITPTTVSGTFSENPAFTGANGIATSMLTINADNLPAGTASFVVTAQVRNDREDSRTVTVGGSSN